MNRDALFALVCCIAFAGGCVAAPSATPTATSTDQPTGPAGDGRATPTPTLPTGTQTPVSTASSPTAETTASGNVSVEYVLRVDSLPDHVAHVYVDFGGVYFAERPDDVDSCAGAAPPMDNRYDPTPTPLPSPAGACTSFDAPRVDLATFNGTRSLGTFTASARYGGGHMLLVEDVTIVLENGTEPTQVYDTDFRALAKDERPEGRHGITFNVTYAPTPGEKWDYVVDTDLFDPDE